MSRFFQGNRPYRYRDVPENRQRNGPPVTRDRCLPTARYSMRGIPEAPVVLVWIDDWKHPGTAMHSGRFLLRFHYNGGMNNAAGTWQLVA